MADSVKAQKLAAARKRLKEYQQKHQSNSKKDNNDDPKSNQIIQSENVTPVDSMVSSTHSAFDVNINQESTHKEEGIADISTAFIDNTNYFNTALFQKTENNHILSNYFDAFSQQNTNPEIQNIATSINEETNKNLQEFTTPNNNTDNNVNQIYAEPFENIVHIDEPIDPVQRDDITTVYDRQKSESALDEINNQNLYSNTENLRQISTQINNLIENEVTLTSDSSELERRNQELASLYATERCKTEELNLQLQEYLTRIKQLESDGEQLKNEHATKFSLEIGPLQEQLQYHVQTVGILVGEKTELTIALNQSQAYAKQKTSECEELQTRLKASKYRVSDLEKEIKKLKTADKRDQENNVELEKFKHEFNTLKDQVDELSEENSELKQKLNLKQTECTTLQQQIQDKHSELSLTQLKLQQLTTHENVESQLEILNQQKISLEQQILELTQTISTINSDRDQANQQYQQYVQQLNTQVQSLADKLETQSIENDNLSKREQSLVKHISDLEKHLQVITDRQNLYQVNHDPKLQETIITLQKTISEAEEKYNEEVEKRNKLLIDMEEKTNLIEGLKKKIEELSDQPDATKLLATMESDKVAASRAVEQNKKLKQQLEELHDGFIKMSNSKLELTEKLESEEFQCRELTEKLEQSHSQIEHLHSVIAIKDKELLEQQNQATDFQRQLIQQNQLTDRLRHYEAQGNASDYVQEELQQLLQTNGKLQQENENMRLHFSQITNNESSIELDNHLKLLTDQIEELEATTVDSSEETEYSKLLEQKVDLYRKFAHELRHKCTESKENRIENDSSSNKNELYLDRADAMSKLEERFKITMQEVANLTEEKHKLEHLVLQLQSETETIGEYVTLYQCQRAMLKEKTLEKDEQLLRLAKDREEMKFKLDELNALIQRLVLEKGVPPEILSNIRDVCKEHSENLKLDKNIEETSVNGTNDNNNENFGTAGKILSLLSEIKTSNLVQPSDSIQNFHPCPWCSGQLITV